MFTAFFNLDAVVRVFDFCDAQSGFWAATQPALTSVRASLTDAGRLRAEFPKSLLLLAVV